ncbi:hypothetical protein PFISCL1PPCAC_652, partial [Pristionchus fissidentatus]
RLMNRRDRLNEDQCQFFGFSPMALGDEIFNEIISSWEAQVDALLETPQWSKMKGNKEARASLINLLFAKGGDNSLGAMCDQIAEYAHLEVFKIPENVVLPGTEPLQQLGRKDPDALRRQVQAAEKRVEEARKRSALLKHENKDVEEKLEVMREVARKLGVVVKSDATAGDTSMRTPVSTMEGIEQMDVNSVSNGEEEDDEDTVYEKENRSMASGDDTAESGVEEMMERSLVMKD